MTRVRVVFSSALTGVTIGEKEAEVSASSLREALDKLAEKYGDGFKERILDATGKPKRLLNFYVNGKNVRLLKQVDTPLDDGDEVTVLPAVSGG